MDRFTREKYNALPDDIKKEVFETYEICRRSGDCRADELRHIVNYYFEKYNAQPAGWFNYFDN